MDEKTNNQSVAKKAKEVVGYVWLAYVAVKTTQGLYGLSKDFGRWLRDEEPQL